MKIRKATLDDTPQMKELYGGSLSCMAKLQPEYYRKTEQEESFVQRGIVEENAVIFVAEENGMLLGLASVFGTILEPKPYRVLLRYSELDTLYVREAARRKGIGKALFEAAKRWAAEYDFLPMQLMTLGNNHAARAFYESMGMRQKNIFYITG